MEAAGRNPPGKKFETMKNIQQGFTFIHQTGYMARYDSFAFIIFTIRTEKN
jgi:hypothetical protein